MRHKWRNKFIALATVGMTLLGGVAPAMSATVYAEEDTTEEIDNTAEVVYQSDIDQAEPTIISNGYGTTVVYDLDTDTEWLSIRNNTCIQEITLDNPEYRFTADDDFVITELKVDGKQPADFKGNSKTYIYSGKAELVEVKYDTKSGEDLFEDFDAKAKTVKQINNLEEVTDKTLAVKYLYVDNSLLGDLNTIDDIVLYSNAVISQDEEFATLTKQGDQYYFTATTPYDNGYAAANPLDWQFAQGNDSGQLVTDGVFFDTKKKTGTISATVFDLLQSDDSDYSDLQVQILVPVELDSKISYPLTIENNMSGVKATKTRKMYNSPWVTAQFLLIKDEASMSKITENNLLVYVNDSDEPLSEDAYAYEQDTGFLGLAYFSNQITSVKVVITDSKPITADAYTEDDTKKVNNTTIDRIGALTAIAYLNSASFDYSGLKVGAIDNTVAAYYCHGYWISNTDEPYITQAAYPDTYFKLYKIIANMPSEYIGHSQYGKAIGTTDIKKYDKDASNQSLGIPTALFGMTAGSFQFYDENGNAYANEGDGTVRKPGKNGSVVVTSKLSGGVEYNNYIPIYCNHTKGLTVDFSASAGTNPRDFYQPDTQVKILAIDKGDGSSTRRKTGYTYITLSVETLGYISGDNGGTATSQSAGTVFVLGYKSDEQPDTNKTNATASATAQATLNVTAYKTDSSTNEGIANAKFDLYVKGWNSSSYTLVKSGLTSDSTGKVNASVTLSAKSFSATSDYVWYITNYDKVSASNQSKYKNYARSYNEAYNTALTAANNKVRQNVLSFYKETKYWKLVETSPPSGYAKSSTSTIEGTFNVTESSVTSTKSSTNKYVYTANATVTKNSSTLTNTPNVQASIQKRDKDSGSGLAGATLTLTDNKLNKVIKTWTTTTSSVKVTGLRPNSQYTITETKAPEGYVLPSKGVTVTTGSSTSTTQAWYMDNWKITFKKVDLSGNTVIGAKITVKDSKGNTVDEWYTTDTEHNIKNLVQDNVYTITETSAPGGFTTTTSMTIVVGAKTENIVMKDSVTRIYKTTANGTNLAGASMQAVDESGTVVDSWTTGQQIIKTSTSNFTKASSTTVKLTSSVLASGIATKSVKQVLLSKGVGTASNIYQVTIVYTDGSAVYYDVTLDGAEAGHRLNNTVYNKKYTIKEVKAPDGYVKAADTTVTTSMSKDTSVTIKDGTTIVTKLSPDGKNLPGALLQVVDSKGNVIDSWTTTTETHSINNLVTGTEYTLQEVKAADGYIIAKDIKFTADATKDKTLNMLDKQVGFRKIDAGGEEVVGATMTVYDTDSNVIDTWKSTTEEHYIKNLVEGKTYIIRESSAPSGYTYAQDYKFVAGQAAATTHYTMKDTLTKVDKVDVNGNAVAGASMQVLDSSGKVVDEWITRTKILTTTSANYTTAKTKTVTLNSKVLSSGIATSTVSKVLLSKGTNSNEYEVCILYTNGSADYYDVTADGIESGRRVRNLVYGNTYTLHEVKATDGYVRAADIKFKAGTTTNVQVSMTDGSVTVEKIGPNGEDVSGAELQVVDKNGNVLDSWTTDGTGHKVSNLYTNTEYTLQETKAADGYVIATSIKFKADASLDKTVTMLDKQVGFKKIDVGGTEVVGATMTVYDTDSNVVDTWKSTTEEHNIKNLVEGKKYVIRETTAPGGYTYAQDYSFVAGQEAAYTHYTMTDTVTKVYKTDPSSKDVSGASMQVLDASGKVVDEWTTGTKVITTTSANYTKAKSSTVTLTASVLASNIATGNVSKVLLSKGINSNEYAVSIIYTNGNADYYDVTSDGVESGRRVRNVVYGQTYTLHEVEAPTGYVRAADSTFKAGTTENVFTSMTDGSVTINKVGPNGEVVVGAQLQVVDKDGKVMDSWTTDGKPHRVSNLYTNTDYTLQETKAAENYVIAKDMKFTASANTDKEFSMLDKIVAMRKVDVAGKEVEGATLEVTDAKGNVVDKWQSTSEEHIIQNLIEGQSYTLKETLAPAGYTYTQDYKFVAGEENYSHLSVTDTIEYVTKYDDDGNYLSGATMQVIDHTTKKVVDEWVTGQNIVSLTKAQVSNLEKGKTVTFEKNITVTTSDSKTKTVKAKYTITPKDVEYTVTNLDTKSSETDTWIETVTKAIGALILKLSNSITITNTSFMLQVHYDDVYEYYIVDKNGNELEHMVRNSVTLKEYDVIEVSAPKGYVIVTDSSFTNDNTVDSGITLIDRQVHFTKEDLNGSEVVGASITVYDEKNNVMDSWVSDGTVHNIENLHENATYTLIETAAPNGYTVVSKLSFKVGKVSRDVILTDTVSKVYKLDPSGNFVSGATMQVLDSKGNVLDEWVTGTQIITATAANYKEAKSKTVELKSSVLAKGIATKAVSKVLLSKGVQSNEYQVGIIYTDGNADYYDVTSEGIESGRRVRNVVYGNTYTIHEVKAPEGYIRNEDKTFTASDKTNVFTNMVNGSISIEKVGPDGEAVVGSELQVVDKKGNVLDKWTTDGKAHRVSNLYTNTEYILQETKAKTGYVIATDISFKADANKDTTSTMLDKKVGFKKTDAGGEEVIGATMTVYDKNKKVVDTWQSTTEEHDIENLVEGQTYTIHEEVAPNGYVYAQDYTFVAGEKEKYTHLTLTDTIEYIAKYDDNNNYLSGASMQVIDKETGTVIDEWTSGQSIVELTAAQTNSLKKGTTVEFDKNISVTVSSKKQTVKAHFTITPKTITYSTTTNQKNDSTTSKSFLVQIHYNNTYTYAIIDENGNELEHMVQGASTLKDYTVVETKAPTGYVIVTDSSFNNDGKKDAGVSLVDHQVHFTKTDLAKNTLVGAHLAVYDKNNNKVDSWVSDGEVHNIENLKENNSYTIVEEQAPNGYTIVKSVALNVGTETMNVSMTDTVTKVYKVDPKGNLVSGASMQVLDSKGKVLDSWVTGQQIINATEENYTKAAKETVELATNTVAKGVATSTVSKVLLSVGANANEYLVGIIYANGEADYYDVTSDGTEAAHRIRNSVYDTTYTVHEVKAPTGYIKANDLTITANSTKNIEKDMTDGILKVDKVGPEKEKITGATLQVVDKSGTVLDTWVSDGTPHSVSNLVTGTEYVLQETKAPDGYVVAKDVSFTANAADDKTMSMLDKKVGALKVDSNNSAIIGATLVVYDTNKNVIDTWKTTTEEHYIKNLIEGQTYTLHEEIAPDGYILAKDYTFIAGKEDYMHIKLTDTVTRAAKVTPDKDEYVIGATMQVVDKKGTVLDSWLTGQQVLNTSSQNYTKAKKEVVTLDSSAIVKGIAKQDVAKVLLSKNTSSDDYQVCIVYINGDADYYDVNTDGVESSHRIRNLSYNTEYTLQEVKAPDGYIQSVDISFNTSDTKDILVTMVDGSLTTAKIGPDNEVVEGAHLQVVDKSGNVVDSWVTDSTNHRISNLVSNNEYILQETECESGYVAIKDISFKADGSVNDTLTVTDKKVGLTKVDTAGNTVIGATLTVYDENKNVVDTWVSTDEEHIIKNLFEGKKYTVQETTAPFGFVAAKDYTFVAGEKDTFTHLTLVDTVAEVSKVDTSGDALTNVKLQVVDKNGKVVDSWTTGTQIINTTEENYSKAKTSTVELAAHVIPSTVTTQKISKVLLSKGLVDGEYRVGIIYADGTADYHSVTDEGVELGHSLNNIVEGETYTVQEVEAPVGYTYAHDTEFVVDGKDITIQLVDTLTKVYKVDASGNSIANVQLQVLDADSKVIDSWTTGTKIIDVNEDTYKDAEKSVVELTKNTIKVSLVDKTVSKGLLSKLADSEEYRVEIIYTDNTSEYYDVTNEGIESGHLVRNLRSSNKYILHEEAAPSGYIQAEDMEFTASDSEDIKLKMIDGSLTVVKKGPEDEAVIGATLQVIDEEGTVVDSWKTDDSEHAVNNLSANKKYTLQEVESPSDEYVLAKDINFTADATIDDSITMIDKKVDFRKLDAGGEEVEGAEITVYGKDNNVVDTWVSTKETHIIKNLVDGETYTLRETVAPGGYVYAQDYTFVAGEKENYEHITLVDTLQYVAKYDASGNYLSGANLQIVDSKTGDVLDDWVSGQSIIELTDEQTSSLLEGNTVEFDDTLLVTKEDTENVSDTDANEFNATENTVAEEQTNDTESASDTNTTETKVKAHYVITPKKVSTEQTKVNSTAAKESALSKVGNVVSTLKETINPTYNSFLLQVSYDNTYDYYIIDANGNELEHIVRNMIANKEYKLVEVSAPDGYVLANSYTFKNDGVHDSNLALTNKQISFTKEDINGAEVVGAKLTVYDKDKNVVDTWVSDTTVHVIKNLKEGNTYTLVEDTAPAGYNRATSIEFKITADGIDSQLKMVDTIQRVIKEADDGTVVKGARLAIYDTKGTLVDEWTTGTHVVDITDEQLADVKTNGETVIGGNSLVVTIDDSVKETMLSAVDNLIDSTITQVETENTVIDTDNTPESDNTTTDDTEISEETKDISDMSEEEYYETLSLEQKVQKIFEVLPISEEELQKYIADWTERVNQYNDSGTESIEDIRTALHTEAEQVFTTVQADANAKLGKYETITLLKNKDSAGGYTLRMSSADGTMDYIDIDKYGDEANHRVSGLTAGEEYVLKELIAPTGYETAAEMNFIADGSQDIVLTLVDNIILESSKAHKANTGIKMTLGVLAVGIVAIVILVIVFIRKKHKNA
jgi:hypothetical protein